MCIPANSCFVSGFFICSCIVFSQIPVWFPLFALYCSNNFWQLSWMLLHSFSRFLASFVVLISLVLDDCKCRAMIFYWHIFDEQCINKIPVKWQHPIFSSVLQDCLKQIAQIPSTLHLKHIPLLPPKMNFWLPKWASCSVGGFGSWCANRFAAVCRMWYSLPRDMCAHFWLPLRETLLPVTDKRHFPYVLRHRNDNLPHILVYTFGQWKYISTSKKAHCAVIASQVGKSFPGW